MTCDAGCICRCEGSTHYYRKSIYGTISNNEIVVFVVIDGNIALGERLNLNHFSTKKLKTGELSLARHKYTTLSDINMYVIRPAEIAGRTINGAVLAEVEKLRSIIRVQDPAGPLRGVCVIDRVEDGDHAGHAALKGCADHALAFTKAESLGKFRGKIAMDLAEHFSDLRDVSSIGLAANTLSTDAKPDAPAPR